MTQIRQLVIIIQVERKEILTQIWQSVKTSWILEGSHKYESCQNNRIGVKPFIIRVRYYSNCNSFIHWIFKSKCAITLLLLMASFNFNQFRKAHNEKCYLFIFRLFQLKLDRLSDNWIEWQLNSNKPIKTKCHHINLQLHLTTICLNLFLWFFYLFI